MGCTSTVSKPSVDDSERVPVADYDISRRIETSSKDDTRARQMIKDRQAELSQLEQLTNSLKTGQGAEATPSAQAYEAPAQITPIPNSSDDWKDKWR